MEIIIKNFRPRKLSRFSWRN